MRLILFHMRVPPWNKTTKKKNVQQRHRRCPHGRLLVGSGCDRSSTVLHHRKTNATPLWWKTMVKRTRTVLTSAHLLKSNGTNTNENKTKKRNTKNNGKQRPDPNKADTTNRRATVKKVQMTATAAAVTPKTKTKTVCFAKGPHHIQNQNRVTQNVIVRPTNHVPALLPHRTRPKRNGSVGGSKCRRVFLCPTNGKSWITTVNGNSMNRHNIDFRIIYFGPWGLGKPRFFFCGPTFFFV